MPDTNVYNISKIQLPNGAICNIKIQPSDAGAVALTGDTMTGNLLMKTTDVDISATNNGVSDTTNFSALQFRDKDNDVFGLFGSTIYVNGDVRNRISVTNGGSSASFSIGKHKNGDTYYVIDDTAAFRSAASVPAISKSYTEDIDNLLEPGMYYLGGATGTGGKKDNNNKLWGSLLVIGTDNATSLREVQLHTDIWSDTIEFRRHNGTAWQNWQTIYTTANTTPAAIGAVDKTGDTMTGYLNLKSTEIDVSETDNGISGNSSVSFSPLQFRDKDNEVFGFLGSVVSPNGDIRSRIGATNAGESEAFSVGVHKDGTHYYDITTPSALCTAIGAMPKAGGDFNSGASINFQSSNIDASDATVVNKNGSHINYYDKNKYIYGVLRGFQDANGNPGLAFVARRPASNGDYIRYFGMTVNSNCEAVYRIDNPENFRSAISAVAITGDTMTGNLILKSTSVDISATDNGISSTNNFSPVQFRDKDNDIFGLFGSVIYANGDVRNRISVTNGGSSASFSIGKHKDGTTYYTVDDSSAFRTALGLDSILTTIGNGAFNLGTIAAGTSKVLQCSTSSHAMLILSGPGIDLMGLYLIRIGASDVPNTVTITQGSKITFTPATAKITIGNTSTGSIAVNVIPLSRNSSYFSLT